MRRACSDGGHIAKQCLGRERSLQNCAVQTVIKENWIWVAHGQKNRIWATFAWSVNVADGRTSPISPAQYKTSSVPLSLFDCCPHWWELTVSQIFPISCQHHQMLLSFLSNHESYLRVPGSSLQVSHRTDLIHPYVHVSICEESLTTSNQCSFLSIYPSTDDVNWDFNSLCVAFWSKLAPLRYV